MPTYTLAQILSPETQTAIRNRIVATMVASGLLVTSWSPSAAGGTENIQLDQISGHLTKYAGALATTLALSRYLDLATGTALDYLAEWFFQLTRSEAAKTVMTFRLSSVPAAPSFDVVPGQLRFRGLTGNEYISTSGGKLKPGGTLIVFAEAVDAGSLFADPDLSIDSTKSVDAFVTPLPGVDAINVPQSDMTPPKLIGDSAGSVGMFFSVPGHAPTFSSVRIRITADGVVGTGSWQYSIDDGVTWIAGGPIANRDIGGVTITFANAPSVDPSFFAGDQWSSAVAISIVVRGLDRETDPSLRLRCRSRWPALSRVPTEGKILLWAHEASPEVGRIRVDADPSKPGQITLSVAGAAGSVGSATAEAVQDFIAPRLRGYNGLTIHETIVVSPAVARPIGATGLVFVKRTKIEAVKTKALANWNAYLQSTEVGGLVRLSELVQAVMDAGALGFDVPRIVGGAPNIQLGAKEVAVPPQDGTSILTTLAWRPV